MESYVDAFLLMSSLSSNFTNEMNSQFKKKEKYHKKLGTVIMVDDALTESSVSPKTTD